MNRGKRFGLFLAALCVACVAVAAVAVLAHLPPVLTAIATTLVGVLFAFGFFKLVLVSDSRESTKTEAGNDAAVARKWRSVGVILCEIGVVLLLVALLNALRQLGTVPLSAVFANVAIKLFLIVVLINVIVRARKAAAKSV